MNPNKALIRQAASALLPFLITVVSGFIVGVAAVGQAYLISQIVAKVFLSGYELSQVLQAMGWLLGVLGVRGLAQFASETSSRRLAERVKNEFRLMLLEKLNQLGPGYTRQKQSAELAVLITQGVEALDAYYSQYLPQLVLAALVPLTILTVVFQLDLLSFIVLLLTAPLVVVFMILVGKTSEYLTRKQWSSLSKMSGFFLDTLQGLVTLKTLNQSKKQAERISKVSEDYRQTTMSVLRLTFLSALVLELLSTLSTAVLAVEIGLRLLSGQIFFPEAFFILVLAPEFYLPLRMLGTRYHAGMAGVSAARKILEVLAVPEVNQGRTYIELSLGSFQNENVGYGLDVQFENVSFRYPGRDEEAISNLNLTFSAGQLTALVGASGSGKSTLVNLLLRFYEPENGRILYGEKPLGQFDIKDWRRKISWVPQSPYIFTGSLMDNFRIARSDASFEEVEAVAQRIGLEDWIKTLPMGYQTQVGERGTRLSAGQAQRLAIGRALIKNAPLLIMDEPSSNLDLENEQKLNLALRELCRGRTVMMIAHRLNTIKQADLIYVLEKGRLMEIGRHETLLKQGGLYTKMLSRQLGES
jgi:ATP-binding cassette subfamily C protein CydD